MKVLIRVPNKFCEKSNDILKSLKMFSAVPDKFHIDLLQWDQLLLGEDIRQGDVSISVKLCHL